MGANSRRGLKEPLLRYLTQEGICGGKKRGCCLRLEKKLSKLGTSVDQSLDLYYADAYWPQDLDSDVMTLPCGGILAWVVFITQKYKPIQENKEKKKSHDIPY